MADHEHTGNAYHQHSQARLLSAPARMRGIMKHQRFHLSLVGDDGPNQQGIEDDDDDDGKEHIEQQPTPAVYVEVITLSQCRVHDLTIIIHLFVEEIGHVHAQTHDETYLQNGKKE